MCLKCLENKKELHSNINRCFDERSKWKNCLHSLINEMTLVYHYDDNGCDVSANGQKQTNKYARSITLLNHKTKIIRTHENKRNLAYELIANEFLVTCSLFINTCVDRF